MKENITMPAEKGSAFLLKIGDGAATPVFTTVAGLRTTQLSINGDAIVITNKFLCQALVYLPALRPK